MNTQAIVIFTTTFILNLSLIIFSMIGVKNVFELSDLWLGFVTGASMTTLATIYFLIFTILNKKD